VRDLLDKGVPGEVIRFVFLSTHYRKPMDWTEKKRQEAEATLRKWYGQAEQALDGADPYIAVVSALADDLNTSQAIAELHQLSHADDTPTLRATLKFLALMGQGTPDWAKASTADLSDYATKLASLRETAAQTKDFSAVDALKSTLLDAGAEVRMSKAGVEVIPGPDFDPSKLEGL
jgi:cysteinyl-tRNA synthetase